MARTKSKVLTELELRIMNVIWERSQASVDEIRRDLDVEGHTLALPSIRTMLQILSDKGYLTRREEGRGHIYSPKVKREDVRKSFLSDIVDRAFSGSPMEMVASLLDSRLMGKTDVAQIKKLLNDYEKNGK